MTRYIITPFFYLILFFTFGFHVIAFERLPDQFAPDIEDRRGTVEVMSQVNPLQIGNKRRFTLILTGKISPGSHIYSVREQGQLGPVPTGIEVKSKILKRVGGVSESPTETLYDVTFGDLLKIHKNQFYLTQVYQIFPYAKPGKHYMKGEFIYQICDNRICSLPMKKQFRFEINLTSP